MRRRPKKLREGAAGHAAQMNSPLWCDKDALTAGRSANESMPRPQPTRRRASQVDAALEILARLEALERTVEMLTEAMQQRPVGDERIPGWLEAAAGNPHDYDDPEPTRTGVCVRITPGTYHQVKLAQRRLGLRTKAGTWEFLLRLGLAAAERLPTR